MINYVIQNQLEDAIKKHKVVTFRYNNEFFDRTFEPYVIYHSPADSNRILVGGVQTKNDSKPFDPPTFHKFDIEFVSLLIITKNVFKYNVGFSTLDKEYRNGIIARIQPI